ncbi:hypothetical protein E4U61_004884 [Claviceps capensis]|nr:hypothetical protein E4U61_004884 [Claviceps capensis]
MELGALSTSLNDTAASAEDFVGVCSLAPIGMSEKEGALEASQPYNVNASAGPRLPRLDKEAAATNDGQSR